MFKCLPMTSWRGRGDLGGNIKAELLGGERGCSPLTWGCLPDHSEPLGRFHKTISVLPQPFVHVAIEHILYMPSIILGLGRPQ